MTDSPVWIHRRLRNIDSVYRWGDAIGIRKMMPPEALHLTMTTVRTPVPWQNLELDKSDLILPAGPKPVQIFAYTIKALTFSHPAITARHHELLGIFPAMDHPVLRPHVSLYKGGRMPKSEYDGELVFGPEIAEPFDANNAFGIKHIKIADHLTAAERNSA